MEDINIIFKNDFGIVFHWKRCPLGHYKKINFTFAKIALHLTKPEILVFARLIDDALNRLIKNMKKNQNDTITFVETSLPQLSLILDYEELLSLQNLVEGALLELGIDLVINTQKRILI
ncbi:hypothetical protein MHTCC0001_13450 [Flavobacteriaceae bacterium MHTCC 0001]